jgi:ATP-dependent Clp protease protease subunit
MGRQARRRQTRQTPRRRTRRELLHLESQDAEKDIILYISSPGGSIYAGLAIYDTMQFIRPDVATMCVGVAMSMASLLLAGGAPGKRMALPNSRMLIHQPSAGFEGQAADIEILANEVLKTRKRIDELYARHTGQSEQRVRADLERDRFFTPDQARDGGLIDRVITHHERPHRSRPHGRGRRLVGGAGTSAGRLGGTGVRAKQPQAYRGRGSARRARSSLLL